MPTTHGRALPPIDALSAECGQEQCCAVLVWRNARGCAVCVGQTRRCGWGPHSPGGKAVCMRALTFFSPEARTTDRPRRVCCRWLRTVEARWTVKRELCIAVAIVKGGGVGCGGLEKRMRDLMWWNGQRAVLRLVVRAAPRWHSSEAQGADAWLLAPHSIRQAMALLSQCNPSFY